MESESRREILERKRGVENVLRVAAHTMHDTGDDVTSSALTEEEKSSCH